jgi:hypothetical protein
MTPMKWLAAVLTVLGILALIVGIIYFSVDAQSLPSFLGPLHHVRAHRKRRGEGAVALAVVLFVVAAIVFYVDRRSGTTGRASTSAGSSTSTPTTNQPVT